MGKREITDRAEQDRILYAETVMHLSMVDGETPYCVPISYGYDGEALYFHTGPRGYKMDVLRENPNVCAAVVTGVEPLPGERPCKWSVAFASVLVFGRAKALKDPLEKVRALNIIMKQHGAAGDDYDDAVLSKTAVVRIDIERLTGKAKP